MAHGTADWWGSEPTSTVHQIQDVGELAVRLGSPVTFDRRGNVMFQTSFESGLTGMWTLVGGTGADVQLSISTAWQGAYSVKVIKGSDGALSAEIGKEVRPLVASKVGLEFSWVSQFNDQQPQAWLKYYDGTNLYTFRVRYDEATNVLQYLDSSSVWQNIATGIDLPASLWSFSTIKLVVDLDAKEYLRVILNETEHDISGITAPSAASGLAPSLKCLAHNTGAGADNHYIYVDNFIITQNEP